MINIFCAHGMTVMYLIFMFLSCVSFCSCYFFIGICIYMLFISHILQQEEATVLLLTLLVICVIEQSGGPSAEGSEGLVGSTKFRGLCIAINVIRLFGYNAALFIGRTRPLSITMYEIIPLTATFLACSWVIRYYPKYI